MATGDMKQLNINAQNGAFSFPLVDTVAREHIEDTSNPHGVTAAQVGAALGGYGYGDAMSSEYFVTDGTFETVMDGVLANMPGYTAKQIQFQDSVGLHGNKFIGTLWKYTPNYVTLEALCYSGLKAIKRKVGGTWQPWEWVNPPMEAGVEYRLTKRHKGKAVYTKLVDMGTLLESGNKSEEYCSSGSTEVVSIVGTITGSQISPLPYVNNDGAVLCKCYAATKSVTIRSISNMSAFTGAILIEYTKD